MRQPEIGPDIASIYLTKRGDGVKQKWALKICRQQADVYFEIGG